MWLATSWRYARAPWEGEQSLEGGIYYECYQMSVDGYSWRCDAIARQRARISVCLRVLEKVLQTPCGAPVRNPTARSHIMTPLNSCMITPLSAKWLLSSLFILFNLFLSVAVSHSLTLPLPNTQAHTYTPIPSPDKHDHHKGLTHTIAGYKYAVEHKHAHINTHTRCIQ